MVEVQIQHYSLNPVYISFHLFHSFLLPLTFNNMPYRRNRMPENHSRSRKPHHFPYFFSLLFINLPVLPALLSKAATANSFFHSQQSTPYPRFPLLIFCGIPIQLSSPY